MTKKIIEIDIETFSTSYFEGTFEEIQQFLEELKKEHQSFESLRFALYDPYSDSYMRDYVSSYSYEKYVLKGSRIETDQEYDSRIKAESIKKKLEEIRKAKNEAQDRAEFERLSKKYGKTS